MGRSPPANARTRSRAFPRCAKIRDAPNKLRCAARLPRLALVQLSADHCSTFERNHVHVGIARAQLVSFSARCSGSLYPTVLNEPRLQATPSGNPGANLSSFQQTRNYDECGLLQSGFPDSGGAAFGAFFLGSFGARASFFCCSTFAATSMGSGGGGVSFVASFETSAACDSPCELSLVAELAIESCRSASSQISISSPLGLPRCLQISCAR